MSTFRRLFATITLALGAASGTVAALMLALVVYAERSSPTGLRLVTRGGILGDQIVLHWQVTLPGFIVFCAGAVLSSIATLRKKEWGIKAWKILLGLLVAGSIVVVSAELVALARTSANRDLVFTLAPRLEAAVLIPLALLIGGISLVCAILVTKSPNG
jgi:hypothetical protein